MGVARSSVPADPSPGADDMALVEAMHAIKDDFEANGWRRMQAALRHAGWAVNHEKVKRLMREHGRNPVRRRRFVAAADGDHDQPIFPDRTRGLPPVSGPNRFWVADLTFVAVSAGFVYAALIMDAWSRVRRSARTGGALRLTVGYAIGRRIDARLTLAALEAAIGTRSPPPGYLHHSDRGSQYAARASTRWSSRPSTTSRISSRASSRNATIGACTRRPDTAALPSPRRRTPGPRSKPQPDFRTPKGPTPSRVRCAERGRRGDPPVLDARGRQSGS